MVHEFEKEEDNQGRHPKCQTTQLRKLANDNFVEGMRAEMLQGHETVVLVIDRASGQVLRSMSSTPELNSVVEELEAGSKEPESTFKHCAERVLGKRKSFSTTRDEAVGKSAKKEKLMGRKEYLAAAVAHCKLFYGTIKPTVHEKSSTVKDMEKYLRQYYERGNPLPKNTVTYLTTSEDIEAEDWELPIQIQPPEPLADLMPLNFDPSNPTSMVKQIFGLRKEGNIVRVNTTDGRKSEAAKERAKNLKNLKPHLQAQAQAQAIVPLHIHNAPMLPGIHGGAAAGVDNSMGQPMNHHMGGQEANHPHPFAVPLPVSGQQHGVPDPMRVASKPEMNGDVRKRRNPKPESNR